MGSEPGVCEACGEPFGMQTDEGLDCDRCDVCGSFQHSKCLLSHFGRRGEYFLCSNCIEQQSDAHVDDEQAKGIPSTAAALSTDEEMTSATAKLESDLNYMLKYLEQGAGQISEQLRHAILKLVKETLIWT